ncbi:MAG: hypothetical protein JWL86_6997 [Rhizobium sp.]|nr:hypothetical protein [Rhizobium sp.]
MTDATVIETTTCVFPLHAGGYLQALMKTGCEMELEHAKDNIAAIQSLGGGKALVLVDMRGVRPQSRSARQYFAGPGAEKATKAVALLIGSPVSSVLGNFFLRFGPHLVPTALFTAEDAALRWLMEHRAR